MAVALALLRLQHPPLPNQSLSLSHPQLRALRRLKQWLPRPSYRSPLSLFHRLLLLR
jgi:hypothetical protein